jgi:hypothetical protein
MGDGTLATPDKRKDVVRRRLFPLLPGRTQRRINSGWTFVRRVAKGSVEFALLGTKSPTFPWGQNVII